MPGDTYSPGTTSPVVPWIPDTWGRHLTAVVFLPQTYKPASHSLELGDSL